MDDVTTSALATQLKTKEIWEPEKDAPPRVLRRYWCPVCVNELSGGDDDKCYECGWMTEARKQKSQEKKNRLMVVGKARFSCWDELRGCYYCGELPEFSRQTVDHVIPVSRGGSHDPSNLVACCSTCNSKKGTKTKEEFREYCQSRFYALNPHQRQWLSSLGIELPANEDAPQIVFFGEGGSPWPR